MPSTRAKVEILMSGEWLYGSVNRGEFAKAIAPDAKRTFKFTRWHRRGGASVAIIRGWLVEGWDWETPPVPAKRKASTKPRRVESAKNGNGMVDIASVKSLSKEGRVCLNEDLSGIPDETRSILCIAADVNSVDELTPASLPAFREALAAYEAGVRA
jgi:hypothetical protein